MMEGNEKMQLEDSNLRTEMQKSSIQRDKMKSIVRCMASMYGQQEMQVSI